MKPPTIETDVAPLEGTALIIARNPDLEVRSWAYAVLADVRDAPVTTTAGAAPADAPVPPNEWGAS